MEFKNKKSCEYCLPVLPPGDAGKVPTVTETEDGYELQEGGGSADGLWTQETGYIRPKTTENIVSIGFNELYSCHSISAKFTK